MKDLHGSACLRARVGWGGCVSVEPGGLGPGGHTQPPWDLSPPPEQVESPTLSSPTFSFLQLPLKVTVTGVPQERLGSRGHSALGPGSVPPGQVTRGMGCA